MQNSIVLSILVYLLTHWISFCLLLFRWKQKSRKMKEGEERRVGASPWLLIFHCLVDNIWQIWLSFALCLLSRCQGRVNLKCPLSITYVYSPHFLLYLLQLYSSEPKPTALPLLTHHLLLLYFFSYKSRLILTESNWNFGWVLILILF